MFPLRLEIVLCDRVEAGMGGSEESEQARFQIPDLGVHGG